MLAVYVNSSSEPAACLLMTVEIGMAVVASSPLFMFSTRAKEKFSAAGTSRTMSAVMLFQPV